MSVLEVALIVLVVIWSVIFIVIAIALVMLILTIKRGLNKANEIIDKTGAIADKVDFPSKIVIASIVGFMAKNSFGTIRKILSGLMAKK